ncbi:MAG: hypothetical protein B9J98_00910 [Candidatus Terraquivivens tikiterensis]|uniref:Bacterial repeat domain-containing protein n=1 Tax=Candidatus Terraquivivens tikiterensis TaxID=1980982 RepID=A0A2R7Y9I5_9ARCH|nr:MAG: hypothetical protein B9J98_00910 [Candidatus Terraquivivens tikiterensis]
MRPLNAVLLTLFTSTLLIGSAFCLTFSESGLIVYRDGVVHVKVHLVASEAEAAVSIPLLAADAYNILVIDDNMRPLVYDVNGSTLTVYTLGATGVTAEYDTNALTSKEAGVWTLKLTAPFQLTVKLPENSTIIYLSSAPAAIEVEGSTTMLTLQPGDWEISYELPAPTQPPAPTPSTATITFSLSSIGSDAIGTILTVDGRAYSDLPKSFTWDVGSSHSFSWSDTVGSTSSGTRYAWVSTSGLSSAKSGSITVPSGGGSVSAFYKTQYLLTVNVNPSGAGSVSLNPSSPDGWYDSGVSITATATPASGYVFDHWVLDGSDVGSSSSTAVFMNRPHTLIAVFSLSAPSSQPSQTPQPSQGPQRAFQWFQYTVIAVVIVVVVLLTALRRKRKVEVVTSPRRTGR